ncbi:MAG: peptidoglycan bridge formation glycyltransferase FemA/FemB family protein, partial [Anaerolineae bacterium]|nr:peptidoglycan bridge formation glycyltransferase FemA/FemB family protein [Anaerolineae bacterium]
MPLTLRTNLNHDDWNAVLRTLPYAHVLQTWEWGEFKRATTGWQPHRLAFERDGQVVAAASVGVRRAGPARVLYAPKGPALDYSDSHLAGEVLDYLQRMARKQGAIWLKIDPDVIAGTGVPGELDEAPAATGAAFTAALTARGWRFSADQVQFRNTITVDLTQSEDALLAAMGQSTRRKIRTAQKEGVAVRTGGPAD